MVEVPGFLTRVAAFVGIGPVRQSSPEDEGVPPDVNVMISRSPEMILSAAGPYMKWLAAPDSTILRRDGAQNPALFDGLLDDDVAMSNLQTRRLAITSRDWEVAPGDADDPRSVKAAEDFKAMLQALGFDRVTGLLHYAVWYGYGVGEGLWTTKLHDGRRIIWLDDIVVPNRNWFAFTQEGELRFTASLLSIAGEQVPPNKFVTIRTGGTHDFAFYGLGLAHWVYWPVWFKRAATRFWALYLEKLSNPTAVGGFGEEATNKEKRDLLGALTSIGTDKAVIVPKEYVDQIKFMEATRNGASGSSYSEFVREQNEAIMRVVLGQPGTSSAQPQGIGGGQAELHGDVAAQIVKADADLICEGINSTFATWVTRWNHGEDVAPPTVYRVLDDAEDMGEVAERDVALHGIGIKRTEDSIKQVYGEGYRYEEPPPPPTMIPGQAPGTGKPPAAANDDEEAEEARRARTQFAAGDETPLYVSRKLKNVAAIAAYARKHGITADDDLHVTVLYSRKPVDPFKMGASWNETLTIAEGGPRKIEKLGDKVVLRFHSDDIQWRHDQMIREGASHDYPEFRPHLSLGDAEGVDIEAIDEPYQGELIFGPELFEPLELENDVLSQFSAAEEDEIDRLAAALADETNPLFAAFGEAIRTSIGDARAAGGGTLSTEGARVALLEAFERFPAAELARVTGLPLLAERGAAEVGREGQVQA